MTKKQVPDYSKSEASAKRMEIWRHNGFLGCARMMQVQAAQILAAPTTTSETKELAAQIFDLAAVLAGSLKTRATK